MANATTSIKQLGFSRWALAGIALVLLGLAACWRAAGPVVVWLTVEMDPSLPFEVEIVPPVVLARPGEVINAVYRIRNNNLTPLEAFGRLDILPASAGGQVQIFLTQCSGLNTFQNSYPEEYDVVFRVEPAALTGSSFITLRHEFVRAVDRP